MNRAYYEKTLLVLSCAGVLFSGYLSAIKFFTSTCAFNEPCPYFMGYPACWYGLVMFLILFVSTLVSFFKNIETKVMAKIHLVVSGLGILFAGYFTIPEITNLLSGHSNYSLGLPTCAYGLIFYTLIFIISTFYLWRSK